MVIQKVSIAVCTRNRDRAIINSLQSIADAIKNTPSVSCELVVIDNGSTDSTSAIVKDWSLSSAIDVQLYYEARPGLSAARNCALTKLKGELFIFTDDDCLMDRDFINAALRYFTLDDTPALRGGRVELGDPGDWPVSISNGKSVVRWHKSKRIGDYTRLNGCLMGANLMMSAKVYEKLGKFDERMGAGKEIPSAEDTDYVFRAYLADFVVEYVPECLVHHFHGRREKQQVQKLMSGYGQGVGALYAKYIFSFPYFCRQGYRDFRHTIKGLILGKQYLYNAESDFTFAMWVYNNALGFFRYSMLAIRGLIAS